MRFNELSIGTKFRFHFDVAGGWEYKKISETRVRQTNCPETEDAGKNGRILSLTDALTAFVVILPKDKIAQNECDHPEDELSDFAPTGEWYCHKCGKFESD